MRMNNFHMLFTSLRETTNTACQAVGRTAQPHARAAGQVTQAPPSAASC